MRLKSFTANSMKEVMQMVREALGEEAIIIATREENGGKSVRVTAAVEEDRLPPENMEEDPYTEDWLYGDDDDELTVVEEITEVMLRHAAPEDVLDQVVSCASVMGLEDPRVAMLAAIENLFQFEPLPAKATKRALMMVGPPGSGKTLAVAKMAARATMNGLSVAVITSDTIRAGGVEQLKAFTRLMQIDLKTADTPKALKSCLDQVKDADQVLIDTSGINPFNPENIRDLARLMGAGDIEPVMVLPAGLDAEESGEMARVFATIGVRRVLPSRIDVARRLGSLLAAAHQGGLSFADASDTAKVADGLTPLSPKRLTQLLMPRAEGARMNTARKAS